MGVVNAPCGILEFTKGRLERKSHSCVGLGNKLHRLFRLFMPRRDKNLRRKKWATVNHK